MIPLTYANTGEECLIRRVGGTPEVKKHLEDMGLIAGGYVRIISIIGGNVILKVKDSRIAINKELAMKIMI